MKLHTRFKNKHGYNLTGLGFSIYVLIPFLSFMILLTYMSE